MGLIKPFKQGKELASEIEFVRSAGSYSSLDIWWLGQSGFLILWSGHTLLLDPYLSDSLTLKYANTNKPHVRMSEMVISPSLLTRIDIVTSSHNHTDHLDGETLKEIFRVNPLIKMLIPEANRTFVSERINRSLDFPIGITDGQEKRIGSFTFTGIASAHNTIERDSKGNCIFMGYVVQVGPFSIYHSGDTLLHDYLAQSLIPFHVDLAFLPINGNDPKRGVAGNLDGTEAAHLGKEINAGLVVPHHYHMFEFNTAEPDLFVSQCQKANQPFQVLKMGERFTLKKKGKI